MANSKVFMHSEKFLYVTILLGSYFLREYNSVLFSFSIVVCFGGFISAVEKPAFSLIHV